ncbi:MAG: GntR family transcriptional regulator [Woeseiales bacterium]
MSIATYIKDDLAARLQSDEELPVQLTLDSLAEFYEVSFTPVRAAVAELIEQGLLEKGANRRLTPCGHNNSEHQPVDKPTLPQRPRDPFDIVSDDLIRLSLEGEAVYLREEAAAEKYGISRSAIRNIFHRLAGSGMLDHFPRRGWRLRPFRQKDLQSFLDVREVLELKALDLARPHLVNAELQKLLDLNSVCLPEEGPFDIDESLHTYIIKSASNSYISDFFKRQGMYFDVLFRWEDNDRVTAQETLRQHRDILEPLLNKDWRTARKTLSYHIRHNHPILKKIAFPGSKGGGDDV